MKFTPVARASAVLTMVLAVAAIQPVVAQTTGTTTTTTTGTTSTTLTDTQAAAQATVPESTLVTSYSSLFGSPEAAKTVIGGLRTGGEVTVNSTSGFGTYTFTSQLGTMGYGNINLALALTAQLLVQQGITEPTLADVQAALSGSNGILAMRASGMGWGQIANSMGVKLGSLVSAAKSGKGAEVLSKSSNGKGGGKPEGAGASAKGGKGDHGGGNGGGQGGGNGGGGGKGR